MGELKWTARLSVSHFDAINSALADLECVADLLEDQLLGELEDQLLGDKRELPARVYYLFEAMRKHLAESQKAVSTVTTAWQQDQLSSAEGWS